MTASEVRCACGSVRIRVSGAPLVQFFCHCDDCQAMNGGAYVAIAVFPAQAVDVTQGETRCFTLRSLERHRCDRCGGPVFARIPGDRIGVGATALPADQFAPSFHINCRYAVAPIRDTLPHYAGFPPELGGTGETVDW